MLCVIPCVETEVNSFCYCNVPNILRHGLYKIPYFFYKGYEYNKFDAMPFTIMVQHVV